MVTMFRNISQNPLQYQGDIKAGDLIKLKNRMMLNDPRGPVLVLCAHKNKDTGEDFCWDVSYLSYEYITTVDRLDIEEAISESR